MSPFFLVKILCYTWRPFTISLASVQISADANVMVKGLHYN